MNDLKFYDSAKLISTHIRLAAGVICSTLFMTAGGLMCAAALIASALPEKTPTPEDNEMRIMSWGAATLICSLLFIALGTRGLFKVVAEYKVLASK